MHSTLPRRDFLTRVAKIAGGSAAALVVLPLLEPNYAQARQVSPDDRHLHTESFEFMGPNGKVRGYLAHPNKLARGQKLPAILVIHETGGLNEHIEDVVRRAGLAGFFAVAPDGLSSAGGTPADPEAARDLFARTDPARIASDILAIVPWLDAHPLCDGKIGSVGFDYGGGMALRSAIDVKGVDAVVAFYGKQLTAEETRRLEVPVMLHYAGNDESIDAGIADFRAALESRHVSYEIYVYPGTEHGFHNDANGARYDKVAAKLAWTRSVDFLNHNLKG